MESDQPMFFCTFNDVKSCLFAEYYLCGQCCMDIADITLCDLFRTTL